VRFFRPSTIEEAVTLLAGDEGARCLAGGATLVAMMNAGLLSPSAVVSLAGIDTLTGIREIESGVTIGAMTRHEAVAGADQLGGGLAVVRDAAGAIGHPAIRTVGTIGGSIAHADPAADYPTALLAAAAMIEVAGPAGKRCIDVREFFRDYYTTALEPGEIVIAVELRNHAPFDTSAYRKVARCDGDFALASVAFCGGFDDGTCIAARVAVGGCGATPIQVDEVDDMLIGTATGDRRIHAAAELLADVCDPIDDVRGSADYRRLLIRRLLPDVLEKARSTARLQVAG